MACAVLLALVDVLALAGVRDASAPRATATAAALLVATALPFGLLQAGGVRLGRAISDRLGLSRWLGRSLDDDPTAPREPVQRFHAAALAIVPASAVALGLGWFLLAGLDTVADDVLRRALSLGVFCTIAGVAVVVWALAARLLSWPAERVDARWGLPWPQRSGLRRVLYLVLPATLVLVPLWLRYRQALGQLSLAIGIALFVLGEIALLGLWQAFGSRRLRLRAAGRVIVPLWIAALALGAYGLRAAQARAAIARTSFASASLALWNNVTDVDRDGFSNVVGTDCAPFDSRKHPVAWDVPGNGVDENCDGRDAELAAGEAGNLPRLAWASELALERSRVEPRRYNIVWVVVDAVRADRTSLLGHKRPTTPYLQTLSREALVFGTAYSQSSATMLSMPSMFAGLDPAAMTWRKKQRLQPSDDHVMLAERLGAEGYRSAIIVDGYIKGVIPGMTQGFDDVLNVWLDGKRHPWHEKSAIVTTALAIEWLERDPDLGSDKQKPFFLLAYSSSPHDPYTRHAEMAVDYGSSELDRYDGEIAYTDRSVGMLIDYLKYRRPLWNDTVFVFTADHGEEFGEHGGKIHAYTCYIESVHVPLMVRIPGVKGRRIDAPVGLVDIVPTLLQALGLSEGDMTLDGQSLLVPAFAPEERPEGRPLFCSVLSQKPLQGNFFRRSVRVGNRVLLHDDVTGGYELYDTRSDPGEHKNLVGEPSEDSVTAFLKGLLTSSMTGNLSQSRLTK
jgi:arylsulfatase A-like enzyme